jgi:glycosyltransferase 2 family protein
VGSVVFVGLLVLLYFLLKHREVATKFMAKMPFPHAVRDRAQRMFINFIDGLQVFAKGRALMKVFGLSVLVWTIEACVFLLMGRSFGIPLTLFQCIFVMIVIGMGAILPTAPGFVGTVEFLGMTSLAFLGINKNLAFGYIITLHLLQLVTITLLGIRSLVTEKISFWELIRIEKQL